MLKGVSSVSETPVGGMMRILAKPIEPAPLQTWRLSFEDAHSYRESPRPFCRRQENLSCSMLRTAPK